MLLNPIFFFFRKYVISHKKEAPPSTQWDISKKVTVWHFGMLHVNSTPSQKQKPPSPTGPGCIYTGGREGELCNPPFLMMSSKSSTPGCPTVRHDSMDSWHGMFQADVLPWFATNDMLMNLNLYRARRIDCGWELVKCTGGSLPEGLGLIPTATQRVATVCKSSSRRVDALFQPPQALRHVRHTCRQDIHIHKIKINIF